MCAIIIKSKGGNHMKKRMLIFLMTICLIISLPMTTYAGTYSLNDTDMSIQVDESTWYVFTRDNIENNPELDELYITYEDMYNLFYENDAYMDAVLYFDDGNFIELFVLKSDIDTGIVNLSTYDDDEILEIAQSVAEDKNTQEYSIYDSTYKYMYFEYFDETFDEPFYMYQYITIVNGSIYTLSFQSTAEFTRWDYNEVESIVDTVQFDVDTALEEPKSGLFDVDYGEVAMSAIKGMIIGGIAMVAVSLFGKTMAKRKNKADEVVIENMVEDIDSVPIEKNTEAKEAE